MSSLKDRSSSPRRDEPPLHSVNIYIAIAFWAALSSIPIGAGLALYHGNGNWLLLCIFGFAVLLT